MDFKEFTSLDAENLFLKLKSAPTGLSQTEAKKRILEIGENKISSKETSGWEIFFRQFKSPFTYLLFGASLLSMLLGERLDGAMITLFVLINSFLSFYQEYRSEQTVKLLKKYLASKIRVVRDGIEVNIETEKAQTY